MVQYIQANGLRFAYIEEGKGPLVLLLHGFPDTAHSWDQVRPALAAAGFRAVSPFMRGYFPTEIPTNGPFDADTLARDALALITALGESQAILVGHDWGATAAFSAVGLDPSKIKMLITVAIPHPAAMKPTPKLLWSLRHVLMLNLPGAAARIRKGNMAHIDELVQRWSPAWKVPPGETDAVKEAFAHPGCLEAAIGYYKALSPQIPAGQQRKVEVPAVAFAGTNDHVDPSLYENARTRYLKDYEVVKVPGGHFMHREHPKPFIDALLRVVAPFAS